MRMFVGIDWASETHAVCVVDARGRVRAQFTVDHSAAGLGRLVTQLRPFGTRGRVAVAIERPTGPARRHARRGGLRRISPPTPTR